MSLKTPLEMFYQNVQRFSDTAFLRQPNKGVVSTYSWRQFDLLVRRVASGITSLDLPKGSHIGLISKNCAEWFIADLAIMLSGHVSVPIYPTAGPDTIKYVLQHASCKVVFVGKLDNAYEQLGAVSPSITTIGFPYLGPETTISWQTLLSNKPLQESPIPEMDSTATIIYTSGSTGNPKGVVHTYRSVSEAATGCSEELIITKQDRMMSYLPLAHIAERVLVEMSAIYSGMQVYFSESLDTFSRDIKAASPTLFMSVPRLWTRFQMGVISKIPQKKLDRLLRIPIVKNIISNKIKAQLGLSSARMCFVGTAPTSPSTLKWFNKLGIDISEGWGMTENCAYGTSAVPFRLDKIGSIGKAFNKVDLRISEEGEIQVKGPSNMKEYYLEPEKTLAAFTSDGFLHTGDKGDIDKDGYVTITGRLKDIFKTSKGKYVTPVPIEAKLAENVLIEQVCVTGGNLKQPIALLVLSEIATSRKPADIIDSLDMTMKQVNSSLESHSTLDHLIVLNGNWTVENDLLTPTLKLKRQVIEQHYASLIQRQHSTPIVWNY